MSDTTPRIALIHALRESQQPAWAAFADGWPQAHLFNVLDDSLPGDLKTAGGVTRDIIARFQQLGRYAAQTGSGPHRTRAILFTCSAFGPAIDAVKRDLALPVLRPNEAAFEAALDQGRRIALMTTFAPSLPPLLAELQAMADARGLSPIVNTVIAEGALQALQRGDALAHDRIAAQAAEQVADVDVLVLCQFSLARAAKAIADIPSRAILTTPDSAVAKLKALLA